MFINLILKRVLKKFVYFLSKDDMRMVDAMIHARLMERTPSYQEHFHYSYWENQIDSWDGMPSPIRPSRGDMEIYQSFLPPESKEEHILILGSTPELRDLAAQRSDAKIYVADFSYRMPLAMLPFTMFVDPMREKWIKDNWLELSFPENFFDIILGDLALQQFPPELESVLLKKTQAILKKEGVFIGRFQFLDKISCSGTIPDIVEKIINSKLTNRARFVLLTRHIVWLFTDLVKRESNRPISAKKFDEYVKKNSINNPILLKVRDSLMAGQNSYQNYSVPEEKELMTILSQYFIIADRKVSNDYEKSEIYPIFSLKPK